MKYPTYLPTDFVKQDDKARFKSYLDGFKPLGSDYEPTKAAPDLFTEAARIAREKGYDDDAGRVVQAILRTEGALSGEVGDKDLPGGGSFGPLQFYRKYGMLPSYAKSLGVSEDDAAEHARKNPTHAIGWALGGYLGNAIREGQAKGLRGAELATYAQQHGQRSQAPERAGQNYSAMFGGGQPIPAHTPTTIGPREAAIPAHGQDDRAEFGKYLSSFPELGSDLQMGKERAIPAHEPKDDKQAFGEFLDSFPKLGGDLLGEAAKQLPFVGPALKAMGQQQEYDEKVVSPQGELMYGPLLRGETLTQGVPGIQESIVRGGAKYGPMLLERGLGETAAEMTKAEEATPEPIPGVKGVLRLGVPTEALANLVGPVEGARAVGALERNLPRIAEAAGKALPEAGRLGRALAEEAGEQLLERTPMRTFAGDLGESAEQLSKQAGTKGALPEGVRYNPKLASEARALPDGTIEVGPKYWNLPSDEARRLVVAHERAHGVGLEEAAFKDNEFWRLMQQEEMFGPIDPETGQIMRGINGAFKPGENVTEAYVLLNEQPQWLKEHYPKAYKYVAELAQREGIPVSQVVADDVKAMTPPMPIKEPLTKPPAIKGKGEKVEQPKARDAAETVAEEGAEQGVQQVQGDEGGVPRGARRPLWEIAGTTAEPPFMRAEPPQGPRRPTDAGWTPSGREPGGAGKMQPYTPPDPLEQLEQAFAKPKQTTRDTLLAAKDKFVRATYDRIQPFKFVERKTGIPVHKLGQVVSGAAAAGEDNIARYILPAIKPVGKNVKALERYMVLRRMEDILARSPKAKLPGGLNGWQGQIGALKLLRNQLGEEQFKVVEQAAEELWRLNDELMLKPKLEAGFISQEAYTKLRSTHPHYIDFHRAEFAVEPAAGQLPASRRVASISDAGIDRMVDAGSDLALDEPLARFAAQAIDTQVRISRNRAARALVEALTQIERESGTQLVKLGETATTIDHAPIYYFENGQMVTAQVPKVYADAAKALEAEPANAVFDFLGKAAMPLRAGAVTLNTFFLPVNIIRDTFSAWLREGLVPFSAEYNRGFIAAVTRNTDFRDAAQAGTLMSGFVESMRTTESMAAARRILGGIKVDNVMDALLVIPRLIERLNVLAEQGPRIGTYILKADTKGLTGLEAAVKGRDVTVDFSKAGNIVKLVNQAIPFLNAGVQGSANTARLVRYDPNGAIVRATPLAIGTIAVWLNNQRFETAKMIPDYEYAYSWPIIIGEGTRERDPKYPNAQPEKFPIYIKVPKGPMVAALIAPVELGLRLAWANDDRSVVEHFLEAGRTTAMAMSPIEPSVSALTPPLLSTGLSVGANYDFFRDQPIVPRGEQERPPELQYGAETSKTAVALGEQFKVSPRLIEFAIRDYTGGVGQQGLWMLDMALGALGYDPQVPGEAKRRPLSEAEQLAKTPGVSRFLGTRNTQEDKVAWEQFDKAVEQSQRKFASVKELRRLGMNLGPVGDTISIADNVKIRLDPKERAELQLMTGEVLTALATRLVEQPSYEPLPDYLKAKVMQSVLNKGREATRKRYLNQLSSSDVKQRVREAFPLAVGQ